MLKRNDDAIMAMQARMEEESDSSTLCGASSKKEDNDLKSEK